jgi:hypothetical protein
VTDCSGLPPEERSLDLDLRGDPPGHEGEHHDAIVAVANEIAECSPPLGSGLSFGREAGGAGQDPVTGVDINKDGTRRWWRSFLGAGASFGPELR